MKYSDVIRTANSNLRKSKLRTILTVSAVFIGSLTLMLTSGVGSGLKSYVNEQVSAAGAKDALIVTGISETENPVAGAEAKKYDPNKRADSPFGSPVLTPDDITKIAAVEGIKATDPLYAVVMEYIQGPGDKYTSVISQSIEGLNQPLKSGRLVNTRSTEHEITIPEPLVTLLGYKDNDSVLGQKLTMAFKDATGVIFEMPATIVGVQEKALINGNQITTSTSLVRDAYEKINAAVPDNQKNQYPVVFARFDSSYDKAQITTLKDSLKAQGYAASTLDDQLGVITNVISAITTFLNIFAGIALVAATFGIVNTLLMAVQERTREIGLMKALGMGRSKIFSLFSIEAILIGFWGALIALGIANILGRVGNHVASTTLFKDFEGLSLFSFPAMNMIKIILLIMFIAFIAATLPARRASKLDPIEALRYE